MSTIIQDDNIKYPNITNMLVEADDIQLIIDDFRNDDKRRITADGIFTPGIVNKPDVYLQQFINPNTGATLNSIQINPFTAYTKTGNRIEVTQPFANLSPIGSSIIVTEKNTYNSTKKIPLWVTDSFSYDKIPSTIDGSLFQYSFVIHTLGAGSVLHGIKLFREQLFAVSGDTQPEISVALGMIESDGTLNETKFMPYTKVSETSNNEYDNTKDLNVINLLYAIDEDESTDIYLTIKSNVFLASSNFNAGVLQISFCIADFNQNTNISENTKSIGLSLESSTESQWEGNMRYYIVARYLEQADKNSYKSLNYTVNNVEINTTPEPTRIIPCYSFYALRKSGSTQDVLTDEDIKLGEVQTDAEGNISNVYINGLNSNGEYYTNYLNLPGYRFLENIDAQQIANGTVSNTQFQYLNTLTGNVQTQFAGKAGLISNNIFTGTNTFRNTINGNCTSVNGFIASKEPSANTIIVLDDNAKLPESTIPTKILAGAGKYYCINSGIKNEYGRPDFLAENTETLTSVIVKTTKTEVVNSESTEVSVPLNLVYSDGTQEAITKDFSIDGLTAGNYYLIKEKDTTNGTAIPMSSSGIIKFVQAVDNDRKIYDWLNISGTEELGIVSCSVNIADSYKIFNTQYRNEGAIIGKVSYMNVNGNSITQPVAGLNYGFVEIKLNVALQASMVSFNMFTQPVDKNNLNAFPKRVSVLATNNTTINLSDLTGWTTLVSNYSINSDWSNTDIYVSIPDETQGEFLRYALYFSYGVTQQDNIITCENLNLGTINGEQVEGSIYTDENPIIRNLYCTSFNIYGEKPDTIPANKITEGFVEPDTALAGDYFLNISSIPYQGKKYDGEKWTQCEFVRLGTVEIIDNGNSNPTVNLQNECFGTTFISNTFNVISLASAQKIQHNLGVLPKNISIEYICKTAGEGYSIGEIIKDLYVSIPTTTTINAGTEDEETITVPTYLRPAISVFNITDMSFTYNTFNIDNNEQLFILDKTTGTMVIPTSTWNAVITINRGY